jgi:hypothetical protein
MSRDWVDIKKKIAMLQMLSRRITESRFVCIRIITHFFSADEKFEEC